MKTSGRFSLGVGNDRSYLANCFVSWRIILRNETFTCFELEKTFATSGSSRTTLVPCAARRAYFPRWPEEKAYSARDSLPFALGDFFITSAFPLAGRPRTGEADIIASIGVDNND